MTAPSALDAAAAVPAILGIVGMLAAELFPNMGFSWRPIQRTGSDKVFQRSKPARIVFFTFSWTLVMLGYLLAILRRAAFPPQTSITTTVIACAFIIGGKLWIHGRASQKDVANGPKDPNGQWKPVLVEWLDERLYHGTIFIAIGYATLGVLLSASHRLPVLILTGSALPTVGIYLIGRQRMHIHPDTWVANLGIIYWIIGWAILLYGIATATS